MEQIKKRTVTKNGQVFPARELTRLCRKAAAEGAVLLKNEGGMLPFSAEDHVAIFGRCQIDYYRSGTGSGGMVNVPYTTNLVDGLAGYPWLHLQKKLLNVYREFTKSHPVNLGDGNFASEPWFQEEMPLEESLVREAACECNKAVFVIGRTAGEEKDNADTPGSLRLTETEQAALALVVRHFTQVAVLFNVSNIMDMSWLEEEPYREHVKAILYTWHGGMEGGNAAADILAGAAAPGGRLTDTIARSPEDYPSHANYGSLVENDYAEDIYVGYRYFSTFAPNKVLYPFGFGLSYTTFSHEVTQVLTSGSGEKTELQINARVQNTGNAAGREVLQLYAQIPQGRLGKPKRVLAAFAKTKQLAQGEQQELCLRVRIGDLASYDDSGVTGHPYCMVLEEGDYRFFLGTDITRTTEVLSAGKAPVSLPALFVTERLEQAAAPTKPFMRMKPHQMEQDGTYSLTYEEVPLRRTVLRERILERLPKELSPETDGEKQPNPQQATFADLRDGRVTPDAFTASLSEEELITIVLGEGMCNERVTSGTAAAFGGISDELAARGIPAACASDGPSGIRRDTGEAATQLPIGTLLACSFDTALVEELFYREGRELFAYKIDTLLGPGINIHRHPFNGRNFEYFSEDPLVTGKMAAACIRGLDKAGVTGTVKHFACNNQETARHVLNSVVSERALREIYLKGFEIAVKEGGARSIMTTYNPLNGYQNANNYDLNTTILRNEWGFDGIVMTDWWAGLNHVIDAGEQNMTDVASMIRSQNDIYMVVNNGGAPLCEKHHKLKEALQDGSLTRAELQRSAKNIIRFLLTVPAADRKVEEPKPVYLAAQPAVWEKKKEAAVTLCSPRTFCDVSGLGKEQNSLLVYAESPGVYRLDVEFMAEGISMSQMLTQVCFNGQPAAHIQTRGTRGARFCQRAGKLLLEQGYYEISLRIIRPCVEITALTFLRCGEA